MAKSVYGRVRAGKAASVVRGQKVSRSLAMSAFQLSVGLGVWNAPAGLAAAAVGLGFTAIGNLSRGKFERDARRTAVVARLVASAKAAKANAPAQALYGSRANSKLFAMHDRMTTNLENKVPGAERAYGKTQQSLQNYYSLVAGAKRQSGAAASISRARQTLDRTAASRSLAASRKAVPRPAGRRPAAEQKGGDGQTEGYYRNQGGKRVFVQGYETPPGRSR